MRPAAALRAPFHLLEVGSGAKSFRDNPVIGSRRLNELGLHVWRIKLAEQMAKKRRRKLSALVPAADRESYARDGFVVKPNFLSPDLYARIRDEVASFAGEVREMKQGRTVTRRASVDAIDRIRFPNCRLAVEDPRLGALVRYVSSHGAEPFYYLQSIVSVPSGGPQDPQTSLHSDTFHSIAKAWLFLDDVGIDDGPFQYVPGSHRMTEGRMAWEWAQSLTAANAKDGHHGRGSFRAEIEDLEQMGYGNPIPMTVPGNTLVVADTHGFHGRSPSAKPTVRIEIYATHRRNPFVPWTNFDLLGAPWIRNRRATLLWRAIDVRDGIKQKNHVWKKRLERKINSIDTD